MNIGENAKVGIVGAGGMLRYHVEGFRQAGAEIVAIADPDETRAEVAQSKFGIPLKFPDLTSMIRQVGCDAVSIITPNACHRPLVIEALSARKHVFCEKPPALNANEVKEMAEVAAGVNRVLMFNFNNRHRPEALALKSLLDEQQENGWPTVIRAAQALWIRRRGIPGFGTWFTDKEQSGGGPLIDLLHMIDLALWFMRYPNPTWVMGATNDDFANDRGFKGPWGLSDGDGPMDVETAANGLVMFDDHQALYLRCSWAEMNKREEVSVNLQGNPLGACLRRLFDRDGLDETAHDSLEIFGQGPHGSDQNTTISCQPDPTMGRVASAAHFIQAINETEEPISTPKEAITLMRIIDGVYESAETGQPVSLD